MAKTHPIQTNFAQGEISPLMGGRYDLDMYNAGLSKLLNMYTDARGGAKDREGFKFIEKIGDGTKARVETIRRNDGTFVTFVFTDLLMTVIDDLEHPFPQSTAAPWTKDQLADLYFSPYPVNDVVYVFHPNVPTQKISGTLTGGNTVEFLADGNFVVPAGITEMTVCVCAGGGGGGSRGGNSVGSTKGGGGGGSGVVKVNIVTTPGESINAVIGLGGAGAVVQTLPGANGGNSTLTSISGTVTALGGRGGAGGTTVAGAGGVGTNGGGAGGRGSYDTGGTTPEDGELTTAVCVGPQVAGGITQGSGYGGGGGAGGYGPGADAGDDTGLVGALSAEDNTGAGGGGAGHPDGGSEAINANGGNGGSGRIELFWGNPAIDFSIIPVNFVNAPPTWTGTNWPSCGVKYQNRLWVAGAPDKPEEFWGSKTNFPEDFDLGTQLADEAIQTSIDKQGIIQWMEATKTLVLGSINHEFIVRSEGGVIIPGDLSVDLQSSYTSANLEPLIVGDQVLYTNSGARKIYAINYEWQQNNWNSVDMTFPSEHITKGQVQKMVWSQDPNNLLWVLLKDGTFACMTYERGSNVFGWHRHTTNGKFLDASAGHDGLRSVLIVAVERKGQIFLEAADFNYKIDSYLEQTVITPYGELFYADGFDHLEGGNVQILIGGVVQSNRIVGAESKIGAADGSLGRIYLERTGTSVVAGLGYLKEMTTLDLDQGAPTGSAAQQKKRRNRIVVKVLNSGPPLINGEQIDDIYGTDPMDAKPKLLTGQLKAIDLNWDEDAKVTVSQPGPLPLTVLAIMGEVSKNAF